VRGTTIFIRRYTRAALRQRWWTKLKKSRSTPSKLVTRASRPPSAKENKASIRSPVTHTPHKAQNVTSGSPAWHHAKKDADSGERHPQKEDADRRACQPQKQPTVVIPKLPLDQWPLKTRGLEEPRPLQPSGRGGRGEKDVRKGHVHLPIRDVDSSTAPWGHVGQGACVGGVRPTAMLDPRDLWPCRRDISCREARGAASSGPDVNNGMYVIMVRLHEPGARLIQMKL
jgi:hypothetical protein